MFLNFIRKNKILINKLFLFSLIFIIICLIIGIIFFVYNKNKNNNKSNNENKNKLKENIPLGDIDGQKPLKEEEFLKSTPPQTPKKKNNIQSESFLNLLSPKGKNTQYTERKIIFSTLKKGKKEHQNIKEQINELIENLKTNLQANKVLDDQLSENDIENIVKFFTNFLSINNSNDLKNQHILREQKSLKDLNYEIFTDSSKNKFLRFLDEESLGENLEKSLIINYKDISENYYTVDLEEFFKYKENNKEINNIIFCADNTVKFHDFSIFSENSKEKNNFIFK